MAESPLAILVVDDEENHADVIAVEAMQLGAFNYLQKPLDLKQLRTIIERACA